MASGKFAKYEFTPDLQDALFKRSDFPSQGIKTWKEKGEQIRSSKKSEETVNSIGTGSLLIFSPLYRCGSGLIRAPLHFKKRDVIEMKKCLNDSDWPVIISLSAVTVALSQNIEVVLGSQWALCLLLFKIWLSEHPFISQCGMPEVWMHKMRNLGNNRWFQIWHFCHLMEI